MKEIVVKRADDEYTSFTKSDYKYLHKKDIEDMYLMCMEGKHKYRETSKKEKRYMHIDEKLKFRDATLKRVSKKVKKINLDAKHGYADSDLGNGDAEFMRFYEYIRERLRHRDQMRHWESYVNGRPLR
ncbi:hypothetical protein Tco_1116376 [Tanacetum coccineum]